jgi:protein required for attachment to host cells
MTTWILVTDAGRGRLFSTELPEDAWKVVDEFEHPASREPARSERTTGPYGRTHQGAGHVGIQSAFEPHTSSDVVEHEHFADELGKFLEKARVEHRFDDLALAAPPQFLGLLKKSLSAQSSKLLKATIDKDLTQLKTAEIRERLVDLVFPGSVKAK